MNVTGNPAVQAGMPAQSWFTRFSKAAARFAGRPLMFSAALLLILGWALSGPIFGFSSTWQLVINTVTTIITFLMVFIIQNTQNRDTEAMQLKLDELIRATKGAHNSLLDLEELDEDRLDEIRDKYEALARAAREGKPKSTAADGTPETG